MKRFLWSGGVLAALLAGCNPPSTQAPVAENAENATSDVVIKSPAHEAAKPTSTPTTKLQFLSSPQKLEAGKAATWRMKIVDAKSGKPVPTFDTVHDKLLHLIVVSKDLSWFTHLHPAHKGNGNFEIKTTIPRAGEFKLYADYTPTGRAQEVAQQAFSVSGANPLPAQPKLVADVMKGAWMTKNVVSLPEGMTNESQTPGDDAEYQVALMPMPATLEAGREAMMHFQIRGSDGEPIKDLQPYLGAMGHLVILSSDSNQYLHAHPMPAENAASDHPPHPGHENHAPATPSSDVMFHTTFPTDGIYKAWGQFRHKDRIITAPFVVKVGSGQAPATAKNSNGASSQSANATDIPANAQKITVELPEGYKSGAAAVQAGTPVALTFKLKSEAGCGNDVTVPAANWRRKMKIGESATVVYTPTKSGDLKFACSMDMMKGSVTVR